jgi:hypothetical protein
VSQDSGNISELAQNIGFISEDHGNISETRTEIFPDTIHIDNIDNKERESRAHTREEDQKHQVKPCHETQSQNTASETPQRAACPLPEKVAMDMKSQTITGFGVTLTFDEVRAIGPIPLNPSFEWWWEIYGVNQQRGVAEARWMQGVDEDNWPIVAWNSLMYVVCTEKQYRKKPHLFLQSRMFTDEIIDRRSSKSFQGENQDRNYTPTNSLFNFTT